MKQPLPTLEIPSHKTMGELPQEVDGIIDIACSEESVLKEETGTPTLEIPCYTAEAMEKLAQAVDGILGELRKAIGPILDLRCTPMQNRGLFALMIDGLPTLPPSVYHKIKSNKTYAVRDIEFPSCCGKPTATFSTYFRVEKKKRPPISSLYDRMFPGGKFNIHHFDFLYEGLTESEMKEMGIEPKEIESKEIEPVRLEDEKFFVREGEYNPLGPNIFREVDFDTLRKECARSDKKLYHTIGKLSDDAIEQMNKMSE